MGIPAESEQTVRFGKFELDLRTRELENNGQKLTLQEQPFQILAALLERPGQLVTRDELTKRLWPSDTFVDFEHSLNKAVNRLREALQDSAEHPRFIETMPRRGYRLIAPLEAAESRKLESPGGDSAAIYQPEIRAPGSRHAWSSLGIILGLACLLAAWLWIGRRYAKPPEPEFQRLSFGRGIILSARFAPDGQSVIYSAAWDGKPSQLFWSRAGSFESRSLGVEASILAISPSGEMAVRGFAAGAHHHKTLIPPWIVNPIGNRPAHGIAGEVVIVDQLGLLFPADPRVLELADPLLLLGIHADNRVGPRRESLALAIDIGKLAVAYPSWRRVLVSRFQPLVIHPQAESHLFQQATYGTGADPNLHST